MDKNGLERGKQIFERIKSQDRPNWGLQILSAFDEYVGIIPQPIVGLNSIIKDSSRWKEAHEQFTEIRRFLLANKKYKYEGYLLLAELVAKITYNASGELAPFDHDSGWHIPALAIETACYFNNPSLIEKIEVFILS
ncbi:MAG: hypothetical protein WC615_08930 [Mucilaginibacter sp.]|jgi:hypothetical protein|uniref:hypothetical protein n=1 Tax=Mucilaginibacter sp. TaxID=1882438 RepID=UPI0035632A07